MVTLIRKPVKPHKREHGFVRAARVTSNVQPLTNNRRPCTPRQASEDHHFSTDPVAWAREVLDFIPDEKQQQVLAAIDTNGILNCTRQWGKSTTCAIKAVHYAYFHPDSLVIVASPSLRQSGEFIRKARKAVAKLGIRPRGDGENRCSILLPNGARIVGIPESEDTIRGFSGVGLMIIDEASRVSDDLYHALRPMLATTNGALWLMSTPNGRTGFFYREWSGDQPWLRIQATAAECPRISAEFLNTEQLSVSEEQFRQDYGCEFLSAEGALFDEAAIRACLTDDMESLW